MSVCEESDVMAAVPAVPGVEPFELVRRPRWPKSEDVWDEKVLLSSFGLDEDLSCPICRGVYRCVMVVKECLHRFCSECIERWIRSGKQDCPQCRVKIGSRRALRPDPIFEQMVRRLFPDLGGFENRNDELIHASNKRRSLVTDESGGKVVGKIRGRRAPPDGRGRDAKRRRSLMACRRESGDEASGGASSGSVAVNLALEAPECMRVADAVEASINRLCEAHGLRMKGRPAASKFAFNGLKRRGRPPKMQCSELKPGGRQPADAPMAETPEAPSATSSSAVDFSDESTVV